LRSVRRLVVKIVAELSQLSCGVRDKIKEYHLSLSSMDVVKGDQRIKALTPEIDCTKTAMDLPPVTFAVFLIASKIRE
jgi:hypothetical protein